MGTSSLYHRACRLLNQRLVTPPRIQICDFNNIKIICARNFVLVLKWHYKYYSPSSLKRPCLSCSSWLPASRACECLKYDTDSDLDHLPAASTSLSKGIEMASKPQRIKLWMACFEQSAEGAFGPPSDCCESHVSVPWDLARYPGCFPGKTGWLQETLILKMESKNHVQQLSTEAR